MRNDCKKYATNCFTCKKFKAYNAQKQGLLNPLFISNRKWSDLFINYVKFLSECKKRNRNFKHILVIINRLTKKKLYKSMTSLNTEKLIETIIKKIFSQYEFPLTYVNDKNI